ncbi:hypothetical protein CDAR_491571 [Caerostris darwini]|uniref:Uncharacterized protein n=1 Tax=Caerostris darwini TaxID=1538125 RepID=A0AAV4X9U9_9ARAC|nr:hypothetical protein CDAR_491571 [Caerostris darwini]
MSGVEVFRKPNIRCGGIQKTKYPVWRYSENLVSGGEVFRKTNIRWRGIQKNKYPVASAEEIQCYIQCGTLPVLFIVIGYPVLCIQFRRHPVHRIFIIETCMAFRVPVLLIFVDSSVVEQQQAAGVLPSFY